ncbi:beta-lactamase/transpeptidase-like protein [Mariannaea sp. PMI_226]|nr:beta-lactamase/transpeptidase-like protein [Mariannaea sp. PMI_226]
MAVDLSIEAVRSRIDALSPILDQIQDNTRTASINIGVLHYGEVIYTRSSGVRDIKSQEPVDSNTMYLLCSLSKGFTACCCGILVEEGKLSWTEPLKTYIPFRNHVDPVIGERATVQDALSHNTGLAHLDLTWLGVECDYVADIKDLLDIVSHLPPIHDLRSGYHYNNYMFAVAGKLIEKQAGRPWYEFLKERILEPLDMRRTRTNRAALPDQNCAEPHVVFDDYSLHQQKPVDVAADDTLMGSAGGVWSCVSDMMKWAKALLDAMHNESSSPLKQVSTIVSHKTNITKSSIGENTYGLGFARATIPSTELGMISLNGPQREHVIGQASQPRLILYHNGGQSGYLTAIYIFPETESAIVVLGNSYGLGDGTDWSAQAITQAMFDLQPQVDFAEASRDRAKVEYERYDRLVTEFEFYRQEAEKKEGSPAVDLGDYVGRFENPGLKMTLDIKQDDSGVLRMIVNDVASQHHDLRYFAGNKLGFLPASREELILREFIDWFQWDQFVLDFEREEESGAVVSVAWAMQVGLPPLHFHKVGHSK